MACSASSSSGPEVLLDLDLRVEEGSEACARARAPKDMDETSTLGVAVSSSDWK